MRIIGVFGMGGMGGEGGTQSQVISDIIFGREGHGALSHLCCNMYGYNFWKSLNWGFLSHPPPVQPPFYTWGEGGWGERGKKKKKKKEGRENVLYIRKK